MASVVGMGMIPAGARPQGSRNLAWCAALIGQAIFVFSVVALSGPGRLDIIDAQTRYEVTRSLVDHGDVEIRDQQVWFTVFPGRDGKQFSYYRLPQSLVGIPLVLAADWTGRPSEARRQFFFSMQGAVACGILATFYSLWFRRLGHSPIAALIWSTLGVFCTPNWFYGTSTFDDILGATAVVGALALAWFARGSRPNLFALLSGLALGAAFNCKQPLGLFLAPIIVLIYPRGQGWGVKSLRIGLACAGLLVGLLVYQGYEWYKYPPGGTPDHAELLKAYCPSFPGNIFVGVLVLLFSPGGGIPWYCPTIVLSLLGMWAWRRGNRAFVATMAAACLGFFLFISSLIYFKGDIGWGPRYLTPMFAVLWVFVPAAAAVRTLRTAAIYLGLGFIVQLLGMSVDPHRLYVERGLPSAFYSVAPWLYFHPAAAHIVNRPREIIEVFAARNEESPDFIPACLPTARIPPKINWPARPVPGSLQPTPLPTSAPPCPEQFEQGTEGIHKYRFLNSFRPWWASMHYLPPSDRPVALGPTAVLLGGLIAGSMIVLVISCRSLALSTPTDQWGPTENMSYTGAGSLADRCAVPAQIVE
jgi:hypothetical protein